jgi:gliding motility-associated-like protein
LLNIPEGLYKVVVEDENQCMDSAQFDVVAMNSATAHAGDDDTLCYGVPYILQGWDLGHEEVLWEPTDLVSDSTIQNPEVTIYSRTQFIYTVYNNTCWDKDTVVLDVYDQLGMDITSSVDYDTAVFLLAGEEVTLEATGDFESYFWYPSTGLSSDTTQIVICKPETTGKYYVIGTTVNGCEEIDSIYIVVAQQINKIYTGFTPNGDGVNDTWVIPHAFEYGDKIEIQVFNRWGQRLFYRRGYGGSNEWDGTYKGKPVPVGTYYYIITLDDGKSEPFTGTVTIIR